MPFPAWHRKRPSGVECCLSSVAVLHHVVIALVTAVAVLRAVIISEAPNRSAEGERGEKNNIQFKMQRSRSWRRELVRRTLSEQFVI